MSILSIFSYLVVFSIFLLNACKKINGAFTINLFFGALVGGLIVFNHFSAIYQHYLFPIAITLFFISYYSVLIFKSKKIDFANLFINAAQILLPIYLVWSSTLWEVLVSIIVLETVRLVGSYGNSTKINTNTILNFININFKVFFLVLAFLLQFLITGISSFQNIPQVDTSLIILPILILYMLTFVFSGGVNSKSVEIINMDDYKSKNILAYSYIYQFLIPFVLLNLIKMILAKISFDIYTEVSYIISIFTILVIIVMFARLIKSINFNIKLLQIKSLTFTALNMIYIFTPKMDIKIYVLTGTLIVLINSILILGNQYKIKYKNKVLLFAYFMGLVTPVSPLFYIFISSLKDVGIINKELVSLIVFLVIILLNFSFHNLSKNIITITKAKQYNLFATTRVTYLNIGAIITFIAIIYDKV